MHLEKYAQFFKPTLIIIFVVTALSISLLVGWIKIESFYFVFPISNMRISTLLTALFCFGLVLFMQRRHFLKSIYYALLAVIFSMGLFEILWYYSAAAYRGWDLRIFSFGALFGWILLGIREIYHKRPPKLASILYLVFIVTMLVWLASGFSFNDLSNASFSVSDEILNVVSKTSLFVAYALHIGYVSRH